MDDEEPEVVPLINVNNNDNDSGPSGDSGGNSNNTEVPLNPLFKEQNLQVMEAAIQGEQEKDLLFTLNIKLNKGKHQDHNCLDKGFGQETILLS